MPMWGGGIVKIRTVECSDMSDESVDVGGVLY